MENNIKKGMRVILEGKGHGHPAWHAPALDAHVGREFTVSTMGNNLVVADEFAALEDFQYYVHHSYLKDITCIPKTGDELRFRKEFLDSVIANKSFYTNLGIDFLTAIIVKSVWTDGEMYTVSWYKATEMPTKARNCMINLDGTMWGITRFQYASGAVTEPADNSVYCSCGGPVKQVATGIGPSSGFYDFCTVCKKERK